MAYIKAISDMQMVGWFGDPISGLRPMLFAYAYLEKYKVFVTFYFCSSLNEFFFLVVDVIFVLTGVT